MGRTARTVPVGPEAEGPPVAVQSARPALTRARLADALHRRVGMSKKDCSLLVDDLFDIVEEGLIRDGKVKLTGFGSFVVHEKAARRGRNPHTAEDLIIAARRVVTFRPSKGLRAALNLGGALP